MSDPHRTETDRVRRHTAATVLRRIDDDTWDHLLDAAESPEAMTRRLQALEREWDIDRAVEAEAATVGLLGLALGVLVRPALLAIPAAVGAGVFLFGTLGLYPLLPLLRRSGLRTAREIQRERHALKALRGDFEAMAADPQRSGPDAGAPLRH